MTKGYAKSSAKRAQKRGVRGNVEAYLCFWCGDWHIGTPIHRRRS